MSVDAPQRIAPKIVVDDGKKYVRETNSLVSALKAARFSDGKLVSGAERITAALERVNAVARNHQLILYLKASPKQSAADRTLLAQKVEQLNGLLETSATSK